MLILKNIGQLRTPLGSAPVRGKGMDNITVIQNAQIEIENGRFTYVGCPRETTAKKSDEVIDCTNKTVLPGFVDSHTHAVFGGYRANEFLMRLSGATYMEIMNNGGGIASTVAATRITSEDELTQKAYDFIREESIFGVTAMEIKSGYGLDLATEIKQLRAVKRLKQLAIMDVKSTFMGAHSIPVEYKGRSGEYIDYIISSVLPAIKKENLADFVDIFCEKGVFTVEESRRLFCAAAKIGFKTKIHADEIVSTGGASLAAECGCTSADHLLHISEKGIADLATSGTVATLLPLTAFMLREPFAPARKLICAGAAVALATDFNPGSCFSNSIPLLIALSVINMHMSINEVITALTLNGACAMDFGHLLGSIEVGKQADFVVLQYPSADFLAYHAGVNIVESVYKEGERIV